MTTTCCVIAQESAVLNIFPAKACNHAFFPVIYVVELLFRRTAATSIFTIASTVNLSSTQFYCYNDETPRNARGV